MFIASLLHGIKPSALFFLFLGPGLSSEASENKPAYSLVSLMTPSHVEDSLDGLAWSLNSVQSLSCVRLFVTPWTAACQASLSITNSRSLLKLVSTESVMPSNHLILCHPLLLPSIFPSIRVFSNESALWIRCPKYWSFISSISPSKEYSELISFRIDWFD